MVARMEYAALGQNTTKDQTDLENLLNAIPKDQFTTDEPIYLNPTFGQYSDLVGGADADIILGTTLLDIKTTKHPKLTVGRWRQLVGYATLAKLVREAGVGPYENAAFPPIKRVGLYFSRYGQVWTVSTEMIYGVDGYPEFESWFVKHVPTART